MSDDERPRKLAKTGNTDEFTEQQLGPAMSGAIPANNESEKMDTQTTNESTLTSSERPGDALNETTETAPTEGTEESAPKMSKNQLKKLRRQAKWEEERDIRKAKRKDLAQKKKERRYEEIKAARENGGACT